MPNSAYVDKTAVHGFCPSATIVGALAAVPGPSAVTITGYSSSSGAVIAVGTIAMVNGEIVAVDSVSGTNITLARGCLDTIPQSHLAGSRIWFVSLAINVEEEEYAPTQSLSVKLRPRTLSGGIVPMEGSPPNALVMNWRFARPYPPGLMQANGAAWNVAQTLDASTPTLALTWAHRNRITQADTALPHTAGSVTSEAGVTYRVRVYLASSNALVATYDNITDAFFNYTRAMASSNFAPLTGVNAIYLIADAMRDGLASWQAYRIDVTADIDANFLLTESDATLLTEAGSPLIV